MQKASGVLQQRVRFAPGFTSVRYFSRYSFDENPKPEKEEALYSNLTTQERKLATMTTSAAMALGENTDDTISNRALIH